MSSIIRELPDSAIQIDVDDKDVGTVTCGSSFFKIIGLSEDEFPPMPKADGKYTYTLDQGAFREMLRKTAYAASTDETRYVLNGVLLSFKGGKLTMVATDGRRLALVEHEVEFPKEAQARQDSAVQGGQRADARVAAMRASSRFRPRKTRLCLSSTMLLVASKLIDGTYPNYKQVIPAQCEERVTLEREAC